MRPKFESPGASDLTAQRTCQPRRCRPSARPAAPPGDRGGVVEYAVWARGGAARQQGSCPACGRRLPLRPEPRVLLAWPDLLGVSGDPPDNSRDDLHVQAHPAGPWSSRHEAAAAAEPRVCQCSLQLRAPSLLPPPAQSGAVGAPERLRAGLDTEVSPWHLLPYLQPYFPLACGSRPTAVFALCTSPARRG